MSVNNPLIGNNVTLYIGGIPKEGPQSILALLDLTSDQILDLNTQVATGKLSGIQAVYMDLSDCDQPVILTCLDTNQKIKAAPKTQGYYPVLSGNFVKFKISSTFNGEVPIYFLNFAIAQGVWSTE